MVRVLFIHPDLGIGGAERLIVDAALALKSKGHIVSFLTNHHDRNHCFEETRNGMFPVKTVGDWLPRSIFGRFYAFCAYFRMVYAAFYASFVMSKEEKIDIIFSDSISVAIPILKLARNTPKILFYCHFPDQLLSAKGGFLKQIYRAPLNYFEEFTTGRADKVFVNSKFTLRIFCETFQRLNIIPNVLYPSLNTAFFDSKASGDSKNVLLGISPEAFVYLSMNRYERKKNHGLAIEALHKLKTTLSRKDWSSCYLVIAGGYDTRVLENVEYHKELQVLAKQLDVEDNVIFLRSLSDEDKIALLKRINCLLYTPENEHFGIVPLEAMYMEKPVIALNSGGPTETVVNESTGFLVEKDVGEFSGAMLKLFNDRKLCQTMADRGRKRVVQKFSFEAFSERLHEIVEEMVFNK
ncbi:ALG2 family protein [Megaselia abdita]